MRQFADCDLATEPNRPSPLASLAKWIGFTRFHPSGFLSTLNTASGLAAATCSRNPISRPTQMCSRGARRNMVGGGHQCLGRHHIVTSLPTRLSWLLNQHQQEPTVAAGPPRAQYVRRSTKRLIVLTSAGGGWRAPHSLQESRRRSLQPLTKGRRKPWRLRPSTATGRPHVDHMFWSGSWQGPYPWYISLWPKDRSGPFL